MHERVLEHVVGKEEAGCVWLQCDGVSTGCWSKCVGCADVWWLDVMPGRLQQCLSDVGWFMTRMLVAM